MTLDCESILLFSSMTSVANITICSVALSNKQLILWIRIIFLQKLPLSKNKNVIHNNRRDATFRSNSIFCNDERYALSS